MIDEPLKLEMDNLYDYPDIVSPFEVLERLEYPESLSFSATIPMTQEQADFFLDLYQDPDWPNVIE